MVPFLKIKLYKLLTDEITKRNKYRQMNDLVNLYF